MWEVISAVAISVLAIAATTSGVLAYRSLRQYGEEFRLGAYTLLLKELSAEDTSRYRSTVRESIKPGEQVENIKTCIMAVRRNESTRDAEVGRAAEKTIVSLDTVGIYLLGDRDKPRIEPPKWFWTMIRDFWGRLGPWVEYRQSHAEDKEFWQEGYGYYFQKLAEAEKRRSNR